MNTPVMKSKEKRATQPEWEQIPKVQQQEMIQILSEMIWRQVESDEPQQDQ